MEAKFIFFIDSEIFDVENFLDENIKRFTKQMSTIFDVARYLEADVYYALEDVKTLHDYFQDESFNHDFSKSQANFLDVLLEDFLQLKEKGYFFSINFQNEQSNLVHKNYSFLKLSDNITNNIVFSLTKNTTEDLLLIKSNNEFYHQTINFFSTTEQIWTLINSVLPSRNYNFSSKHGNSTTRAITHRRSEIVSQLLCTNEEAQVLLKSAIFDKRHKARFYYNFDASNNTFIVFPFEGENPQNQFHAFHIESSEWSKEIPKSIRNYFGIE